MNRRVKGNSKVGSRVELEGVAIGPPGVPENRSTSGAT
jgi:hypothetical protein